MKKNKFIFITVIAMLMIGGVIAFKVLPNVFQIKQVKQAASLQASNELGISTEVTDVEASSLTKEINYIGTIEPENSVVLSPKVTSQVFKVNVQEGDSVKKGDVIGKLDDSQLVAALDTIVKKIGTLQVNHVYLNEEVQKYYTSNPMVKKIETLKVNYTYLSDEEQTYRILYEQGVVSESTYDKVKHEKDMLEMQLEEAKASSEDTYNKLKNQRDIAEAQLKELYASVNELKINIAETNMVAPISGKVRMLYYETGDLAAAGKPFAVIDNTESFVVKVSVSEQDLGKISVGSKTVLNITGMGHEIEVKVTRIMPSVNANTRIGEVEIGVAEPVGANIVTGTSVEVGFITDEVEEGIVISKIAIKDLKDKKFVYVIENDVAHQQEIKTGLVVGDNVQVIEGLNTGEKIAVKNLTRIYDGAKVYVVKGEDK